MAAHYVQREDVQCNQLKWAIIADDSAYITMMCQKCSLCINTPRSSFDGCPPLVFAVFRRKLSAARALLQCGASVNAADSDGLTVCHILSMRGDVDALETIVRVHRDLDVNRQDADGCTPLHFALTENMVAFLLECGASWSVENNMGKTPSELIFGVTAQP